MKLFNKKIWWLHFFIVYLQLNREQVKVYDGALGTVLTDTYTVDVFLRNFSVNYSSLKEGACAKTFSL